MYWHKHHRLAFLANPRTASRSVAAALKPLGFRMEGSHHSGLGDRVPRRTFCVVRHHCDTLVSWGEHLRKPVRDEASLRYVLDRMKDQKLIRGADLGETLFPWAAVATDALRFEDLELALNDWLFVDSNQLVAALPQIGESDRPATINIFTPPMVEMVHDRYGEEMETLGYAGIRFEVL